MNKEQILIVDDEPEIRKLLEINLSTQGYGVLLAESAREGLALAASRSPDMILLDIGLPDISGLELLGELRSWYSRPVIVLSVLNDEALVVEALGLGANDYVYKPFRTNELLARIRACLNRKPLQADEPLQVFGDLEIDLAAHTVRKHDTEVRLTPTEFRLLRLFVQYAGRVLTHSFLLKEVWGTGFQSDTQYLRVFVGSLRKKLEDHPEHPRHILTESGVGYRFH